MKLIFLILPILVTECLGCSNFCRNNSDYNYNLYRRRYPSYYVQTINCTITCSNIYTISDIFWNYKEQFYDQFLKIDDSNITTLHSNELSKFTTILKLFLSNNHIQTILPGAFTGLTKLKELYLDNNNLSEISKGIFTSLHRLEILDLSENNLVRIEQYALMGVSDLKTLYLQNNKLSQLDDNIFDKLSQLSDIDLSGNPLIKVPNLPLTGLNYLNLGNTSLKDVSILPELNSTMKVLNLTSSHLDRVDFSKFRNVETLDVSNNNLSTLENFQNFQVDTLDLSNNKIRFINGGFKKLLSLNMANNQLEIVNNTLFNDSKSMLVIHLGFNNISLIEKDAFRDLSRLRYLFLQSNTLTKIEPRLFKDLTSLMYLSLANNSMEELQHGTFENLKSLLVLDISYNKILELHPYNFYSLQKLQLVDFSFNKISSFDVDDMSKHLSSLKNISLNGNSWKCRQLIQMSQSLNQMGITIKEGNSYDVENFHGVACQNDKISSQENIPDVSMKQLFDEFQNLLNETLNKFEFQRFLNEDFENSNFVKFFRENYNETNFVKFFSDYNSSKSVVSEKPALSALVAAPPVNTSNSLVTISIILQFVMCSLLIFMVYLMLTYLKAFRKTRNNHQISQVELCSDY
ncbi:leucine-rich repeat-containing G-protein coupled receptor 4-like [Zophobas morio]|uniref:leucine-rich repeat-containing G-protein coupled receptor 4-like n=1 Tax=Zophobas morio TaxID=2755281 RepID=UPI0030829D1E